jgi:alpha-maltose-1-phosphate synthase
MSPMLLLTHPTGNANVRAAARAFQSANLLQELHSCICWDPESTLARFLPTQVAAQLARRSFADVPLSMQHSHPWREVLRLLGPHLPRLRRHEIGPLSIDAVYRSFDRHVAARIPQLQGLQAVYAYEDGALQTFKAARCLGLTTIYDLPIGYWRAAQRIFEEERELQPQWACTLTGLQDSPAKLARKDEELQLADQVIVASAYVRSTLLDQQACSAPIAVVPYGAPAPLLEPPATSSTGPLRVLYVGSLGQRKGLSYALEAIGSLGTQVSLTLIGNPTSSSCKPLLSALGRHRHITSLPHHQILEQMRQHDVLLFPTLFDGFGLVITEALSQGLPVISTVHSGAPECIQDGVEGFIVPIRNRQAIAERLQQLSDDRDQLAAMRQACLQRAAELSWSGYEQGLQLAVGKSFQ